MTITDWLILGKIYVYDDHLRTETIKISNGQCSHTKTFKID